MLGELGGLGQLGFDTLIVSLKGVETLKPIEMIGRDVIPQAERL